MAAFASSYIKTEASQVTRSADSASMVGSNFSSWFRADQGSVYCEASAAQDAAVWLYSISDGSNNNRIEGFHWSTRQAQIVANNVDQALFDNGTVFVNTFAKTAVAYKLNDSALSLNGASPAVDTSCLVPLGINRLNIGGSSSGSVTSSRVIKKLAFYPTRLTNAQLQALTQN
jgi:hypothetical protein